MNIDKRNYHGFKLLVVTLLSQLVVACTSAPIKAYEGEERNSSDVAVIMDGIGASTKYKFSQKGYFKTGFSAKNEHITLRKIDNVPAVEDIYYYHSPVNGAVHVAVLPGKHTLSVKLTSAHRTLTGFDVTRGGVVVFLKHNISIDASNIQINVEKGHTYLLSYMQKNTQWTPVVIDLTTWKKTYPSDDLYPIDGARLGPGIQEWMQGKPILLK